jgi:hypothetical protein
MQLDRKPVVMIHLLSCDHFLAIVAVFTSDSGDCFDHAVSYWACVRVLWKNYPQRTTPAQCPSKCSVKNMITYLVYHTT